MLWKKSLVVFSFIFVFAANNLFAQERPRVVGNQKSENQIFKPRPSEPVERPTYEKAATASTPTGNGSSKQVNWTSAADYYSSNYSGNINEKLQQAIDSRIGIPYVYGSVGPDSYDCSGLVWSVFQDAGIDFTRTSAGSYWNTFQPATEQNKYQFGTLVFFNKLAHVGIVANETGFYHASSSKGVTFSPFTGYWEKRIVGFRRIPINSN